MQSNTKDLFDVDKRMTHSWQYHVPPPSDGGTWMQVQEQVKAKMHSEQIPKVEKYEKPRTTECITQLKDRAKRSEGSGMETDQAEHF